MITSVSNPKLKRLVQLQKKSKVRNMEKVFVAEGFKMYQEAPVELIERVFVSEHFYGENQKQLAAVANKVLEIVDDRIFKSVAETMAPQGIITILKQKHYKLTQMLETPKPLLLLLENLQDPGNLGTIFRTAEGAGVTGILMSKGTVDIYNPKTIRSTMGSVYRVPFLYTEDLADITRQVKEQAIKVYAAHLKGQQDYDEVSYQQGSAFLIGNEGNGLSDEITAIADTYIKIPMKGQVESLNVGIAAGILMYEVARQRKK